MAQLSADGDAFDERAEAVAHGLAERLQGLEAGSPMGSMDAEAFAGTVIDQDEEGGLALAGERGGKVRAPHLVDALGADGAVVRAWSARPAEAMRRLQPVLAGQA